MTDFLTPMLREAGMLAEFGRHSERNRDLLEAVRIPRWITREMERFEAVRASAERYQALAAVGERYQTIADQATRLGEMVHGSHSILKQRERLTAAGDAARAMALAGIGRGHFGAPAEKAYRRITDPTLNTALVCSSSGGGNAMEMRFTNASPGSLDPGTSRACAEGRPLDPSAGWAKPPQPSLNPQPTGQESTTHQSLRRTMERLNATAERANGSLRETNAFLQEIGAGVPFWPVGEEHILERSDPAESGDTWIQRVLGFDKLAGTWQLGVRTEERGPGTDGAGPTLLRTSEWAPVLSAPRHLRILAAARVPAFLVAYDQRLAELTDRLGD